MPTDKEKKIKKTMRRKRARGEKIDDPDAYLYGSLRKTGWKPKRGKNKLGARSGKRKKARH